MTIYFAASTLILYNVYVHCNLNSKLMHGLPIHNPVLERARLDSAHGSHMPSLMCQAHGVFSALFENKCDVMTLRAEYTCR